MFTRPGSSPLARGLPENAHPDLDHGGIIPARAGFTQDDRGRDQRRRDHPRSRGVYSRRHASHFHPAGSSPLARGLPRGDRLARAARGIIPARAGFTRPPGGPRSSTPDHPRSRGVYEAAGDRTLTASGSSPLARGLLAHGVGADLAVRIIPARAGFTRCRTGRPWVARDHPRSRGVYAEAGWPRRREDGSSPLARGLRVVRVPDDLLSGIIPARAGFTSGCSRCFAPARDHPRSRGVYIRWGDRHKVTPGSSPLARGLRQPDSRFPKQRGIIPARAGFTALSTLLTARKRDHPRSRGVYSLLRSSASYIRGSSPLARGLPPSLTTLLARRRIIPARAGFTERMNPDKRTIQDHPRSRGVYDGSIFNLGWLRGSSPLARGLPPLRRDRPAVVRIIPARAGFTDRRIT